MIDDGFMHIFAKHLIQYSSELSGWHYVSMVLRYFLPADARYVPGHVVEHECDTPVESFVVHSPYVEHVELITKEGRALFSHFPK
jgi:hypothetical protein